MKETKVCPFCGEALWREYKSGKLFCKNDDCMLLELEDEYMLIRLDRPLMKLNIDLLKGNKDE